VEKQMDELDVQKKRDDFLKGPALGSQQLTTSLFCLETETAILGRFCGNWY
jgi:hypothetical protein